MKNIKSVLGVAAVAALAGTTLVSSTDVLAWGDSDGGRPSYTVAQINNGAIDNKIVFNSISDNPDLNELYFVQAMPADSTTNVWNANDIEVENGKEYLVRIYVHNNNRRGTEMVAKDVTVNAYVPTESAKSLTVTGSVTSSNATPTKVWDEFTFKSSTNTFHLEYVPGSAYYNTKGAAKGTLSDNLVMGGTKVGYDALDGNIPGCFGYSGIVTYRVKVVFDYEFSIQKWVRIKGETEWKKQVNAKVGDTVEYKIGYQNTSDSLEKDVILFDKLGSNQTYVKGSTKLYNSNHKTGVTLQSDGLTTKEGINIGDAKPGAAAVVTFEVVMKDNDLGCGGDNVLRSWAQGYIGADATLRQDYADVLIYKGCPTTPEPTPVTPVDPTPTPTPTPVTPTTPTVLPQTGASDIMLGVTGLGSTVTAGGYFLASRKKRF
ncbi:LPXTG cell wall anchor domain-containing protein [Candidatus Saccharibacteria bacterium]|nr:LPXTG cell wall anchor domain-containing protein [Candidatus Saccharibacteria bacterium]